MKIAKSDPFVVRAGDVVKVSVSHQIKVNRDESWVGYEITHIVGSTEKTSEIEARLIEHANVKVMESVDNAVEKIRSKA